MRAYVIAEIGGRDQDASAAFRARLPALVERHGGRILLRGIEQEAQGRKRGAAELPQGGGQEAQGKRRGAPELLQGIEQEAQGRKRGAPELLAIAFPTLRKARGFMADPDSEAAALVSSGGLTLRLLVEDPAPAASEGLRPEQLTSDNHD